MKKWTILAAVCVALAGCHLYEADMDKATAERNERRAAYHQEFGCPFTDDHAALRECVIKTHLAHKPKTYRPSETEDGKALAIVRDETTSSFDEEKNTYKTERVIVIETEERLEPLPTTTAIIPFTVEKLSEEEIDKTPVEQVEQEDRSWWEKQPKTEAPAEPECPCPDPNDPCPQCVEK